MHQLEALFQQAEQDCQHYLALLEQEREALTKSDLGTLEQVLNDKHPLVEKLANHDQTIKSYCTKHALSGTTALASHVHASADASLQQAYAGFINALADCKQANDQNARLVRHGQHSTRSLLDLLRNQGEPSSNVYDQLGNHSRSGVSRDLTKA